MVVNDWGGGYVFSQVIPARRAAWGCGGWNCWPIWMRPCADGYHLSGRGFLPERIDFDLTLADDVIRLGDTPSLTVDARYLFGAPGADLAIEGETLLRAASVVAGWEGYSFGRHGRTLWRGDAGL